MMTDQSPKPKSSIWKLRLLLLALAVASLLLFIIPLNPVRSSKGFFRCVKCFLAEDCRSLYICSICIYDKRECHYSGTPELKAWQHVCPHLWTNGGFVGAGYAKLAEQGGMDLLVENYGPGNTDHDEADWAWFMQKATGVDFGVTYDDANYQPVMLPGTIEKIMAWWKAEGKTKYPPPKATSSPAP